MRSRVVGWAAIALLFCTSMSANAAILTFDDLITGATLYDFDADADTLPDARFTTLDPFGFNTAGPGPLMTYIQEPGLEGTSELDEDLRVDFLVGAEGSLSFGFALNSDTEDDTASFYVYDSGGNLLASATEVGLFTLLPGDVPSSYPEGYISVSFAGTAAYATFDFTSDYGRYIIDNFEGQFGTTERPAVPVPGAFLLGTMGAGVVGWLRRRRMF